MTRSQETKKMLCSRCGHSKENMDFTKNPKTNEFYKVCNKCMQYKQDNREHVLEQARDYAKERYETKREEILQKKKEYRDNNNELVYRQVVCEKCQKLVMHNHMGRRRATKRCLDAQAKPQEK